MKSSNKTILFYIERVDANGNRHYSVASYSNTTGTITHASDYFFNSNKK